jgi:hypothetical protein
MDRLGIEVNRANRPMSCKVRQSTTKSHETHKARRVRSYEGKMAKIPNSERDQCPAKSDKVLHRPLGKGPPGKGGGNKANKKGNNPCFNRTDKKAWPLLLG